MVVKPILPVFVLCATLAASAGMTAGCAQSSAPAPNVAPTWGYEQAAPYLAPEVQHQAIRSTEIALVDQMTRAAQFVTLTAQAMDAQSAAIAVTQIAATQVAAEAAQAVAQATIAAADANAAILGVTATSVAVADAGARAAQEQVRAAAMAEEARLAAEIRASEKAAYDVRLVLGIAMLAVLVFVGWAVADVVHVYLRAQVAVRARRDLLILEHGFVGQYVEGEGWVQIGAIGGALPEPAPVEGRVKINRRRPYAETVDVERRARNAWRAFAWQFLRAGERLGTFSRRELCAALGITEDQHRLAVAWLVDMGCLAKADSRPNAPQVLPVGESGYRLTARDVMGSTAWLASWRPPADTPPAIVRPHTTPPPPDTTGPHRTPPPTPPEPPEIDVVEGKWTYAARAFDPSTDGLALPFDVDGD